MVKENNNLYNNKVIKDYSIYNNLIIKLSGVDYFDIMHDISEKESFLKKFPVNANYNENSGSLEMDLLSVHNNESILNESYDFLIDSPYNSLYSDRSNDCNKNVMFHLDVILNNNFDTLLIVNNINSNDKYRLIISKDKLNEKLDHHSGFTRHSAHNILIDEIKFASTFRNYNLDPNKK